MKSLKHRCTFALFVEKNQIKLGTCIRKHPTYFICKSYRIVFPLKYPIRKNWKDQCDNRAFVSNVFASTVGRK